MFGKLNRLLNTANAKCHRHSECGYMSLLFEYRTLRPHPDALNLFFSFLFLNATLAKIPSNCNDRIALERVSYSFEIETHGINFARAG